MRVLHIEDDARCAEVTELILRNEDFYVYSTPLGEDGISIAKLHDYDIILLDLTLPDMSGLEVLRQLRTAKITIPIMVLTGLYSVEDKVRAFGLGADEYMTKPFHKDELIARIHAIVRRYQGHSDSILQTDDLVLNLGSKTVTVAGRPLHLTGKEYGMLELLALRMGSTLSKEHLLSHLYGGMHEPEVKIIDVFLCKLRKKLAKASGGKSYIETVWGRGYRLKAGTPSPLGDKSTGVADAA